jgi:hypothetical protein
MTDNLNLLRSEVRVQDLRNEAETWRLAHSNGDEPEATTAPPQQADLVIRMARPVDDPVIARLAQLDGHRLLDGPLEHTRLLIAEVEGEVLAVLPLDGDHPLANPFRPTASLVEMLELRATQLRPEPPRRGLRACLSRLLRNPGRGCPATAPATPGNAGMLIQRD